MGVHGGGVSPDTIIADVTAMVNDQGFKEFPYGTYLSQIQQAMQDLALDTLFDDRTFIAEIPSNGLIDLPEGFVNLEKAFLFNGDRCDNTGGVPMFWARNYTRYVKDFKEQRGNQNTNPDPFMTPVISDSFKHAVHYFNIRAGQMHVSEGCQRFEKVFLNYRGIGMRLGDAAIIPYELRTAVKNFAAMNILTMLLARYPGRFDSALKNVKADHFGGQGPMDVGTWKQAQRRVQSSHMKYRSDIGKYLTSPLVKN